MLQLFYLNVTKVDLDVAYVFNGYTCISSVSDNQTYVCKCFSCFRRMLQVFHLDVAKVVLVLHMLQWDSPVITAYCSCWGATRGHRVGA
jgi:hypothetical protein